MIYLLVAIINYVLIGVGVTIWRWYNIYFVILKDNSGLEPFESMWFLYDIGVIMTWPIALVQFWMAQKSEEKYRKIMNDIAGKG